MMLDMNNELVYACYENILINLPEIIQFLHNEGHEAYQLTILGQPTTIVDSSARCAFELREGGDFTGSTAKATIWRMTDRIRHLLPHDRPGLPLFGLKSAWKIWDPNPASCVALLGDARVKITNLFDGRLIVFSMCEILYKSAK